MTLTRVQKALEKQYLESLFVMETDSLWQIFTSQTAHEEWPSSWRETAEVTGQVSYNQGYHKMLSSFGAEFSRINSQGKF